MLYFYDADNGLDAVIPAAEPEPQAEQPKAEPQETKEAKPESPAWMSQLPKEMRESMTELNGFKTIADLANDWKRSRDSEKDALHIPTKESTPEQVKEFFKKWGVP